MIHAIQRACFYSFGFSKIEEAYKAVTNISGGMCFSPVSFPAIDLLHYYSIDQAKHIAILGSVPVYALRPAAEASPTL